MRAPVHEAPAMQAPVAFHAVSEHETVPDEDGHRPNRKRRHAGAAEGGEAPLQLVETQAATPAPAMEDELPRRTKPRRRPQSAAVNEPLQLVETQATAEPAPPDAPAP
jgi:hypothetical protein